MARERGVTVLPRGSGLASSRVVLLLDGGGWVRWPGAIRRRPRPSCAGWEAMSVPSSRMLLRLVERWRDEAVKAGRTITRIVLAYETGRDGFWLARRLRARGIEAHVIHSASVAVSREHRRAKTDRLDTEMLMRVLPGWLRGERKHCSMVAIPTLDEEDAKRPSRERESLVGECTRIINRMKAALARLGIRGFKPELRKAAQRLETLRTPADEPIPPNTLAEIRRDMARLGVVREQID